MDKISRRSFFRRTAAAGAAGAVIMAKGAASANAATGQPMATVIDLTRCDGCANQKTPLCVSACQTKNRSRFPEPVKPIMDYWPRKGFEDWSDKKGLRDRHSGRFRWHQRGPHPLAGRASTGGQYPL